MKHLDSSAIVKKPRSRRWANQWLNLIVLSIKLHSKNTVDGMKSKMSRRPVKAAYHGEAMDNKSPRQMKDPKNRCNGF